MLYFSPLKRSVYCILYIPLGLTLTTLAVSAHNEFHVIISTNDYYFSTQQSPIGSSNASTRCSLWGTSWIFMHNFDSFLFFLGVNLSSFSPMVLILVCYRSESTYGPDWKWVENTDMRRLATGIRSEKCVVRRFRLCANLYLHKPRYYSLLHT